MSQSSTITKTIVETVADQEEASPDELPSLAENLEAETYQQLTASEDKVTEPLTFEYLFYKVTVLPDGEVVVTP